MRVFSSNEEKVLYGDKFRHDLVHILNESRQDFLQVKDKGKQMSGLALIVTIEQQAHQRERLTWLRRQLDDIATQQYQQLSFYEKLLGGPFLVLINSLRQLLKSYPAHDLEQADEFGIDYSHFFLKVERDKNAKEYNEALTLISELSAERQQMQSDYGDLQQQFLDLQADAKQSNAYQSLQQEVARLRQTLSETQAALRASEQQVLELSDEREQLADALTQVSSGAKLLKDQVVLLETQNHQLETALEESRRDYEALTQEFNTFKQANDEKHGQTQAQLTQQAQQMQDLQRTVSILVSRKSDVSPSNNNPSETTSARRSTGNIQSLLYRPQVHRNEEPKPINPYKHFAYHGMK